MLSADMADWSFFMAIPVPEKRIADFEKMGLGLFIHFGMYSQLGCGEWIMNIANRNRCKVTEVLSNAGKEREIQKFTSNMNKAPHQNSRMS